MFKWSSSTRFRTTILHKGYEKLNPHNQSSILA
ncbi:hypothetical protein LINPERHAP1_LOCUS28973 [Linum perenne]